MGTEPERPWDAAVDPDDPLVRRRIRSRRRARLWALAAALLFVAAIAVAVAAIVGSAPQPGESPTWARVASAVLTLLALAVVIATVVRAIRGGLFKASRRSPLRLLSWAQRRRALRQIRGRAPLSEQDRPLVRRVAEQLSAQRPVLGLPVALILMQVGLALLRFPGPWALASLVLAVLLGLAAVLMLRDIRSAEAFLHRDPGAE
jgi:hypothetical protein